jgi:opacity protein-like surface antigen
MKKLVLATVLLLGLSATAMAQDVPLAEVFAGYSFNRCDIASGSTCNYDGWNAAVDFNFNKNWGAVIDLSGYYGWRTGGKLAWADQKAFNFLFGPRYTFRTKKVTPFLQALVGINHVNPEKIYSVQNNFSLAFGGGVDVNVTDKISIRPVQLDYFTNRIVFNGFSDNIRFSTGVVFKFGKR